MKNVLDIDLSNVAWRKFMVRVFNRKEREETAKDAEKERRKEEKGWFRIDPRDGVILSDLRPEGPCALRHALRQCVHHLRTSSFV
jgi:hypothetical protein